MGNIEQTAIVSVPVQWPESPSEMGKLMRAVEHAEALCKMIRDEVKRRLNEDVQVDGWSLRPGSKTLNITDPQGLYRELSQDYKATPEQFLKCCTVNITKLGSLFQMIGPDGSITDNKIALREIMKRHGDEKQGAPQLKRRDL